MRKKIYVIIFIADKEKAPAINSEIGVKSAVNSKIGDKSAINHKEKIVAFLTGCEVARTQEIATYIGLKVSRTKDYLSELVDDGKIIPNGANKNRTYSLKKSRTNKN